MIRLVTAFILMMCAATQAQTQYESAMKKAFSYWEQGENKEAVAMFERISAAESENWLPAYYIALISTTEAFNPKNKDKMPELLEKAQKAQNSAMALSPNNPELLVLQAMIHTAWIVQNPSVNGMKLSPKVNALYAKAKAIAPNNPRVVSSKAEFDIGSAAYFGNDTAPMCAELEKALQLFATFKPETPFHPNWGKERTEQTT